VIGSLYASADHQRDRRPVGSVADDAVACEPHAVAFDFAKHQRVQLKSKRGLNTRLTRRRWYYTSTTWRSSAKPTRHVSVRRTHLESSRARLKDRVHEALEVDTMASDKVVRRRRHSDELKAQMLAECEMPGASVAKVAMANGINANVVHRWRQLAREGRQATAVKPSEFVAVAIAQPTSLPAPNCRAIEVELRRGAVTMKVIWPSSAAADFAAWTRELLR
jgi:transposase